jgi:hypothetical protein
MDWANFTLCAGEVASIFIKKMTFQIDLQTGQ